MEGDSKQIKSQAAEKLVVIEKSHMQIYESALAVYSWQKTASMDEALALGFLEGGLDAANFILVTNGLRQAADITMPLDYAQPMIALLEAAGFSYTMQTAHDGVNITYFRLGRLRELALKAECGDFEEEIKANGKLFGYPNSSVRAFIKQSPAGKLSFEQLTAKISRHGSEGQKKKLLEWLPFISFIPSEADFKAAESLGRSYGIYLYGTAPCLYREIVERFSTELQHAANRNVNGKSNGNHSKKAFTLEETVLYFPACRILKVFPFDGLIRFMFIKPPFFFCG